MNKLGALPMGWATPTYHTCEYLAWPDQAKTHNILPQPQLHWDWEGQGADTKPHPDSTPAH